MKMGERGDFLSCYLNLLLSGCCGLRGDSVSLTPHLGSINFVLALIASFWSTRENGWVCFCNFLQPGKANDHSLFSQLVGMVEDGEKFLMPCQKSSAPSARVQVG